MLYDMAMLIVLCGLSTEKCWAGFYMKTWMN